MLVLLLMSKSCRIVMNKVVGLLQMGTKARSAILLAAIVHGKLNVIFSLFTDMPNLLVLSLFGSVHIISNFRFLLLTFWMEMYIYLLYCFFFSSLLLKSSIHAVFTIALMSSGSSQYDIHWSM